MLRLKPCGAVVAGRWATSSASPISIPVFTGCVNIRLGPQELVKATLGVGVTLENKSLGPGLVVVAATADVSWTGKWM